MLFPLASQWPGVGQLPDGGEQVRWELARPAALGPLLLQPLSAVFTLPTPFCSLFVLSAQTPSRPIYCQRSVPCQSWQSEFKREVYSMYRRAFWCLALATCQHPVLCQPSAWNDTAPWRMCMLLLVLVRGSCWGRVPLKKKKKNCRRFSWQVCLNCITSSSLICRHCRHHRYTPSFSSVPQPSSSSSLLPSSRPSSAWSSVVCTPLPSFSPPQTFSSSLLSSSLASSSSRPSVVVVVHHHCPLSLRHNRRHRPPCCCHSGDSSVVRAADSWLKGRGFESLQERRENFLLQVRLSVLTLISVSVPPLCYRSST